MGATARPAGDELERLVHQLPGCRDTNEALRAIERAFVACIGSPLAILSRDGDVLHHTPGFLPGASRQDLRFVPLITWRGQVGALLFQEIEGLPTEISRTVELFASQTALAILRSSLRATDRFQETLLNSIAHNVRTPLASVIGVLGTLQEDEAALNPEVRRDLIDTAREEADRLNRLLGNLLDFSRIESGAVLVRADPCDIEDVIGAALEQLGAKALARAIDVAIDPRAPLVAMDFALIVQVLVNLLDNALKYSPGDAPIAIRTRLMRGQLEVRVEDEGDGIGEADLEHVFEKFNRAGRTGETGGIGLGLSICKGLIEAHHGVIWAERRDPRGVALVFRLPMGSGG